MSGERAARAECREVVSEDRHIVCTVPSVRTLVCVSGEVSA